MLDLPILIFNKNKNDLKTERLRASVQSLPGGEVLVVGVTGFLDREYHVLRLDNTGCVIQTLIVTQEEINGFILIDSDVLLVCSECIIRVRMSDGVVTKKYNVKGVTGSLVSGLVLDEDNILLVEWGKPGRVFTYCLSDGHTEDKVNNLKYPQTVIRIRTNKHSLFIVSVFGSNSVNLYNSRWRLQTSITQTPDGPLDSPSCVTELPSEPATILIVDRCNHRLSQFTTDGRFIKHIIQGEDIIRLPNKISYCHPYLYATCQSKWGYDVKCFKLY